MYYDDENKCKYYEYRGCSPIGFETQSEFEKAIIIAKRKN